VTKKICAATAVLLGITLLGACGYKTPPDLVAVRVGAGPTESAKIKGCVDGGSRKWFWQTNDKYVKFPTSEREWDATGKKDSDSGRFSSITKDNVVMKIPVTIRFTLKTDCKNLTNFYAKFARRYDAHFTSSDDYTDGWETLLRKLIADPSDFALDRIVQEYNWRDVWKDPATKVALEKRLTEAINDPNSLLVQTANGKAYFENLSVIIGSPDPTNPELKAAVAREQAAVSDAQSKEAEARARAAQAQAEKAVAEAEAAKQRATIAGYPSVEAYLKAQCIAKGCNPYQPTFIWPGASAPQQ
jgi:hypothetical protein